jgi:hypothetical protein
MSTFQTSNFAVNIHKVHYGINKYYDEKSTDMSIKNSIESFRLLILYTFTI